MGNWIISPSEGVRNNNDGSFVLPCSMSNVDYNITYVNDEGCSSNTVTYTYVTSGECGTCTDFMGNLSITTDALPAASASSKTLGVATKTADYTSYTFESSNKSMIDNIKLGIEVYPGTNQYYITGDVFTNTDSYRSSTISVIAKGPNTPSSGCPGSFTLEQEAGGGGGSCPVSGSIISMMSALPAVASTIPMMRVLKDSTYTGYSFTSSDTSKMDNIELGSHTAGGWYLVTGNTTANTGNLKRTIPVTVKMSGTTTPSSGCNYIVYVEQKGVCDTIYNDYYVGAWRSGYTVPGSGSTSEAIAYVSHVNPYKSFAESGWTVELVGTYSFVSNPRVTNESGGPGGSKRVVVNIDANNTSSNRTFSVKFTGHKTDGYDCERTIEFTQTPATQTCTCGDLVFNGIEEEPVTQQFKVKIQIHNATNDTIYWDAIDFSFADGNEESPETCDSCQGNTTTTWNYGGAASTDKWVSFVGYTSTDTPTLSSALINLTDSSCNAGGGVKTLTTTQTTWHNGDTILLQYNG